MIFEYYIDNNMLDGCDSFSAVQIHLIFVVLLFFFLGHISLHVENCPPCSVCKSPSQLAEISQTLHVCDKCGYHQGRNVLIDRGDKREMCDKGIQTRLDSLPQIPPLEPGNKEEESLQKHQGETRKLRSSIHELLANTLQEETTNEAELLFDSRSRPKFIQPKIYYSLLGTPHFKEPNITQCMLGTCMFYRSGISHTPKEITLLNCGSQIRGITNMGFFLENLPKFDKVVGNFSFPSKGQLKRHNARKQSHAYGGNQIGLFDFIFKRSLKSNESLTKLSPPSINPHTPSTYNYIRDIPKLEAPNICLHLGINESYKASHAILNPNKIDLSKLSSLKLDDFQPSYLPSFDSKLIKLMTIQPECINEEGHRKINQVQNVDNVDNVDMVEAFILLLDLLSVVANLSIDQSISSDAEPIEPSTTAISND